jgi:MoaA/NifB/PqqE/SkfB family radical SAM enzyme
LLNNRIPGQLIIQMTDRCNARCPQCGMRVTEPFTRSTLSTDTIKKIIDAAVHQGIQVISLTGGEPLLDINRLVKVIRYAGKAGISFIRTGTNGFLFSGHEKKDFEDRISRIVAQLADTPLRNFWISLDSAVDSVHEEMRGFPDIVAGIEKALPIFHDAGIYPAVNLGINRNVGGASTRHLRREQFGSDKAYLEALYFCYIRAFENFYRRAVNLGFTIANTCYPMSVDAKETEQGLNAIYGAAAVEDIVRFTPDEKQVMFSALIAVIRQFRSKIRIFSPICSLEALVRQYSHGPSEMNSYGCRGGIDFFFIDATDGNVYPCGFRGNESHGPLWGMDIRDIRPEKEKNACRRCDWECFRDPSELFGPVLELLSNPAKCLQKFTTGRYLLATWLEDLRYYRACGFFNGRQPLDNKSLKHFSSNSPKARKDSPPYTSRFNEKLFVN